MVTHDEEYANKFADKILILQDGELLDKITSITSYKSKSKDFNDKTDEYKQIKKNNFPFKFVHKLALNNIVFKKMRLTMLVVSLVLSFFLISLIFTFVNFDYGKFLV